MASESLNICEGLEDDDPCGRLTSKVFGTADGLNPGVHTDHVVKTKEESGHINLKLPNISFGKLEDSKMTSMCLLDFETLPEMSHFDVTCDPTVDLTSNELNKTPAAKEEGGVNQSKPPEISKHFFSAQKIIKSTEESSRHFSLDLSSAPHEKSDGKKPTICLLDFETLPESTLYDITCDTTEEFISNEAAPNKTVDVEEKSNDKPSESATINLPCTLNQTVSPAKDINSHNIQNGTFDQCVSDNLEDLARSVSNMNNTFDCKPVRPQNATVTLSDTDIDRETINPKDSVSEVLPKLNATVELDVSSHKTLKGNATFDAVSGSKESKVENLSKSVQPVTKDLSDSSQVVEKKSETDLFNMDETLDLTNNPIITSTPMPNYLITRKDSKKENAAETHDEGSSKAVDQTTSNIICEPKTLLTKQAPTFLKPPSKIACHLLKNRGASALSGQHNPVSSGLPIKRPKIDLEAGRKAAAQQPQESTGISCSYTLRSTNTASKPVSSGLQRPQVSGIPSAVQRTRPGLRAPSGQTGSAGTRIAQAKKHQLTRSDASLPIKKKKKDTDGLSNSSDSSSPGDAANKTKNTKQPAASQRFLSTKPQRKSCAVPAAAIGSSNVPSLKNRATKLPAVNQKALPKNQICARCCTLERQLKEKSEEIQRLKEELRKFKNLEECGSLQKDDSYF